MEPINPIALILILGLEIMILNPDKDKYLWYVGMFIVLVGWILNILTLCGVFK